MMAHPSALRAMWLLARLRLLRLLNQTNSGISQGFKAGKKSRAATAGKQRGRWIITTLAVLVMSFSFGNMAFQSVRNLNCVLVPANACPAGQAPQHLAAAADALAATPFPPALAGGVAMQLSLLFLVSFLLPLAARELSQPDWDLEWLVTLPASRRTLLWGRLLERSLANPGGLLALLPSCLAIAWYSGHVWSAPLLAAVAAFPLLMLAALLRTLVDTGLRLLLPPAQLRNLQAFVSVVSILPMYLAMSLALTPGATLGFDLAAAFPAWAAWTPPGLVVQMLNARGIAAALPPAALLALQVAALLQLGIALLRHQLRDGVVAAGSRESARQRAPAQAHAARRWRIGSVVQRRELRLLSRDRNFLVQSLLLPVVIVLSQLLFNGQLHSIAQLGENPATMAALAFAIGAYVLVLSAFQTLNTEGGALWLLYTFPASIERVLKEKAQLWAMLTLAYPLAVFGIGLYFAPAPSWQLFGLLLVVLAGIPIYSLIAVSLGVFACDPLAQDERVKVHPTYLYLYMLLATLYSLAIYAGSWPQKIVVIVLTASLALALWQKARDELPYLLDPAASPPPRVSSADGLIAATLFYLLQAALLAVLGADGSRPDAATFALAFGIGGALTYALVRVHYWRSKTAGVPRIGGAGAGLSVRLGLAGAACAAIFGLAYLYGLGQAGLLPDAAQLPNDTPANRAWFLGLAVLAAPLCEEFIFRGLIFGGLRRSMGALPAALASAAIFAIVHPPASMLPVFVVGLCTAWAYERSKTLLAPMLAHAGYNAIVVGCRLLF
ncbi:CPBP family intramembrane glutamic endopeptidase [Janthinobacterium fluminis]|uniref:CPBP family intramembrane metalloprotease n=1 Tax=Janthinobacterium fluminis TaxID=2987524 RepID=A0ABT5K5Z1_9BURK|nr:CPBP family intramembrane glutamic endopeptidase [Janthinobacterium fluminis]MDC8759808.1 CPBP family intramembrane metalloprotease [Janthinobacterium fluminis]